MATRERERERGLAWDRENTIMSSLACVSDFKAEKPHKEREKRRTPFLLNFILLWLGSRVGFHEATS
ncbi:hypothetical protein BT93_F2459 [Corymbia citriodora subsp. variegata]|nr:hypothetical protein BT93_F2459 [Corymbia citriodora subsp. variegata]